MATLCATCEWFGEGVGVRRPREFIILAGWVDDVKLPAKQTNETQTDSIIHVHPGVNLLLVPCEDH
jgi:hypothetical protein